MKKAPMGVRQYAAWAGMLAPVLFVTVFTIAGLLRQGYDPLSTYVSELSLGPGGWIQKAEFYCPRDFDACFFARRGCGISGPVKHQKAALCCC